MGHAWGETFYRVNEYEEIIKYKYFDFIMLCKPIFLDNDDPKVGELFAIYIDKNNCWLCRLTSFFTSSESDMTTPWVPKESVDSNSSVTKWTTLYYFDIVRKYRKYEDINTYSVLHGFSGVYDDTKYYSAIPMINDVWHLDNYIVTNVDYVFNYKLTGDLDNFELDYDIVETLEKEISINEHPHTPFEI